MQVLVVEQSRRIARALLRSSVTERRRRGRRAVEDREKGCLRSWRRTTAGESSRRRKTKVGDDVFPPPRTVEAAMRSRKKRSALGADPWPWRGGGDSRDGDRGRRERLALVEVVAAQGRRRSWAIGLSTAATSCSRDSVAVSGWRVLAPWGRADGAGGGSGEADLEMHLEGVQQRAPSWSCRR